MSYEIRGKLVKVLSVQSGTNKNGEWKKQDFVIETIDAYPKKVCLTIWNDKISMLESAEEGDELRAMFNVASREYNEKWYTDVTAYLVENLSKKDQDLVQTDFTKKEDNPSTNIFEGSSADDDLPF